jgi:hypothetical protein
MMTDKQVADMQAASDAAQAATDAAAAYHPVAEDVAVDPSEEISMEQVLGAGTLKKPVVAEEAEVPKAETQTV